MTKKEELIKRIFETVYEWGGVGLQTDENSPTFQSYMKELQELDQPQIDNNMNREQEHKVKVKYPEIREVLHKLWRYAYIAGQDDANEDKADTYDFSSAYQDIETLLDQPQEEIVNKCKKECCNNVTLDNILHKVKSGKNSWAGKCKECGEILVFTERNELPQEEIEEIKLFDKNSDGSGIQYQMTLIQLKMREHTRAINQLNKVVK